MIYSKQQKKDAHDKLSVKDQDFVLSGEISELVTHIAEKHHLDKNQEELLDSEVYYTSIGLQKIDDLIVNLEKSLSMSEGRVLEIVGDLKSAIFEKLELFKEGSVEANNSQQISPQINAVKAEEAPAVGEPIKKDELPREKKWWETELAQEAAAPAERSDVTTPGAQVETGKEPSHTEITSYKEELTSGNAVITEKPPLNILEKQAGISAVEQKLGNLSEDPSNPIIKKSYPIGQDPYREPIN